MLHTTACMHMNRTCPQTAVWLDLTNSQKLSPLSSPWWRRGPCFTSSLSTLTLLEYKPLKEMTLGRLPFERNWEVGRVMSQTPGLLHNAVTLALFLTLLIADKIKGLLDSHFKERSSPSRQGSHDGRRLGQLVTQSRRANEGWRWVLHWPWRSPLWLSWPSIRLLGSVCLWPSPLQPWGYRHVSPDISERWEYELNSSCLHSNSFPSEPSLPTLF